MNVLVIPEDFRKDQFILQPIIAAMLSRLGQPAIVEVLRDPLIGGIDQATKPEVLEEILQDNQWKVDLFLLCVDRDGHKDRRTALDRLEEILNRALGTAKFMVAENAWHRSSKEVPQDLLPLPGGYPGAGKEDQSVAQRQDDSDLGRGLRQSRSIGFTSCHHAVNACEDVRCDELTVAVVAHLRRRQDAYAEHGMVHPLPCSLGGRKRTPPTAATRQAPRADRRGQGTTRS